MQIAMPNDLSLDRNTKVYVEHKGEQLAWDISKLPKKAINENPYLLFAHVNDYWARLPEPFQDEIFSIYKKIYDLLILSYAGTDAEDEYNNDLLARHVQQLYKFHNIVHIKGYVENAIGNDEYLTNPVSGELYMIKVPVELVDSHDQIDNRRYTQNKTYSTSEYVDLICLTMQLRPMLPIWGLFISSIFKTSGASFKELVAFGLMRHTGIDSEPAYRRLYDYVQDTMGEDIKKNEVLDYVSSAYGVLSQLAYLAVRKLLISDFSGNIYEGPALVQHISTTVTEKTKRSDSIKNRKILPKNDSGSSNQDEESQLSSLEAYKIREEVSAGDRIFLRVQAQDAYTLAKQLNPLVTRADVDAIKASALDRLIKVYPVVAQTKLLEWALKPVLPHRAIEFFSRKERAEALCAAHAAYWKASPHRGPHQFIATLLTALSMSDQSSDMFGGQQGIKVQAILTESKSKTSTSVSRRLYGLFPYRIRTGSKSDKRMEMEALKEMATIFQSHSWVANMSKEKIEEAIPESKTSMVVQLPGNFRDLLGEFLIDVLRGPNLAPEVDPAGYTEE